MEGIKLEEKASFYREKLPQMIPYLSLSITSSEPTVEAGVRLSYDSRRFQIWRVIFELCRNTA